jgi:hypothetical protein
VTGSVCIKAYSKQCMKQCALGLQAIEVPGAVRIPCPPSPSPRPLNAARLLGNCPNTDSGLLATKGPHIFPTYAAADAAASAHSGRLSAARVAPLPQRAVVDEPALTVSSPAGGAIT